MVLLKQVGEEAQGNHWGDGLPGLDVTPRR
jgi:hypothetical protein